MILKKITLYFFFFAALSHLNAQQFIENFVLINADTDADIAVLTDGMEIDAVTISGINLNIRADANPAIVGSVFLVISGEVEANRVENVAPYALFGDVSGDYLPSNLPVGNYTLTATPYSLANLGGTVGTPWSIQFSIVDIPLNQPPASIITANPLTGVAPLDVDFTGDLSTDDVGIASFFWDFKDGTTSSETNPSHTFMNPGDYQVDLTVTDDQGLFDTSSITIQVTEVFINQPPTAVLQASTTTGNAPLEVTFTGSNSTDDIGVTSYLWEFGDGETSNLADPVHIFTDPGDFETRLTVFDNEGLQDVQTITISAIDINEVTVLGELKKWHVVELLFNGPFTSETDNLNPFLDYRLNVLFTSPTGRTFTVPGFYAADGNAAETSADSGNKWAARFTPDEIGQWSYTASFRTGNQIAISLLETDGTPTGFDTVNGTFAITNNDKALPDNRANGRLSYTGGHFYQFEETQTYFLKAGADSPENMLAYGDFDNTVNSKDWQPHVQDWSSNDPVWQQSKGMGLIGAVNYLSNKGMNAFSFLTMSINGDGQDVWPWAATDQAMLDGNTPTEIDNRLRYDVSKLDQWEIIFSHGDSKGMFLHFKTQETENDLLLDGGELDVQRKLYYRELIARFGHHLALNWNLGEENDLYDVLGDVSNTRIIAYADYINSLDPYDHPITIHSFPDGQDQLYLPLLGNGNEVTGPSIQSLLNDTHEDIKKWVAESQNAGKPWAVANDEQGNPQTGVAADADYAGNTGIIPDNRDEVRYQSLWGTLLAGGYGVEYYFGYSTGETDLTAQDFRSRETKWDDAKLAIDFFQNEIPFWLMQNADELTTNNKAYCLAQANETYLIYLPGSESTNLNLDQADGTYSVQWFDPSNGGGLQDGSILNVVGGLERQLGNPPSNPESDWVILLKKKAGSPIAAAQASITEGDVPLEVVFSSDQSSDDIAIVSYFWDFGDGNTSTEANPTYTFTNTGVFQVSLTVRDENDLEDTDTIMIVANGPNQPPVALVGATPQTGSAPLEVAFTGSGSTDDMAITSYSWDFKDGGTSTEADPIYIFTSQGTYEVELTVMDDEGLSDTNSITIDVSEPNLPPAALAVANPTEGTAPLLVLFDGSGSTDDAGIVSYFWDFKDGTTSTEVSPENTFSNSGTYDVELTVTDGENLSDTATVTIMVTSDNEGPVAVASATPLSGDTPLEVSFTGDGSNDDVAITSFLWDFGDGNTSSEANPMHTFIGPGTFNVSLTVSDVEGLQDTTFITITATDPNQEGITGFVLVNADTDADLLNLFEGLQINSAITENMLLNIRANTNPPTVGSVFLELTGPVQNTRGESVAPYALFGDVSGDYLGELLPLGNYTISATPYSGPGLSGVEGETISVGFSIVEEVVNQPPIAIASANPNMGQGPLLVDFTGSGSTDDIGVTQFLWDFDDNGATSTESDPSHIFNTAGTYNVSLTVTDGGGLQDSEFLTIVVDDPPSNTAPTAIITASPESGEAPLDVSFSGDMSIDDVAVVSYAWDFDDGSSSNLANPLHTFTNPGSYNVTLTVADAEGLEDTETITIIVDPPNAPPVAVATGTPLNGNAPLLVNFMGSNSTDDIGVTQFLWDFDDNGATSTESDPSYIFNTAGTYNVSLTVTDGGGLQDSEFLTIVVDDPPSNTAPTAIITASPESGEAPLDVSFSGDMSIDDVAVVSYAWDFDDGSSSNLANPLHTFTNPGSYNVTLTVADAEGLEDTETITIIVDPPNAPPVAVATGTPLSGDAPLTVNFTGNASSDDKAITLYVWDFDDNGASSTQIDPAHTFVNPGTYNVSLTVSDEEGLQDVETVTIQVTIPNQPPTAIATAVPLTGDAPLQVDFTGSASTDDVGITSYLWDFDDGTTSTLINPSYIFTSPGSYNVTLTVADSEGLQDTDTITITVDDPNSEGVIGFTLVNASSNSDILELSDNLQIESTQTNGLELNIRANTNPTVVGSVRLELQGAVQNIRNENVAPYALFGDLGGDYLGVFLPEGSYTLSATSYSGPNQTGVPGATFSISFSIVPPLPTTNPPLGTTGLHMSVSPNPAHKEAHLHLSESRSKIAEVYLYDALGRRIKTLDGSRIQWVDGEAILPIYEFEEGLYFVVAVTQSLEVVKTKMVVKEKNNQ